MGNVQLPASGRRTLQAMTMVLMALEFILANALLEDEMAALSSSGSTWKEPEKRNTWWSKRANAKDAGKRTNEPSLELDLPLCALVVSAAGCYVETCVPLVFECGRTSDNKSGYAKCRSVHSACLAQCVRNLNRVGANLQK
ncbi:uncharacterized protein LOC119404128 isoform X6 [Rhipicephalus sanguineus]|uniref:uncharacterized protein LOC119404128 isoform X1 n=1 Tax=Rhipicephalus sanguineus TaxID=34632 RepID=UPI0018945A5A|nr:uncharacterized protein LOC119404128 isoform X1 [Rhipicephalus sanguineus]XP_049275169.1 uncharacterized protein LOC119404128 isoform X2 [Rhipicephalus sanguineus]XP_049275170.1 uncharacterized protein LOC119404128 isoform X3 [Rhipicephalus sanguineus]XP_049275171.1 uncharacterized protein LOC119404128 isoform X4 [Rhipicephalus sanguineus]XP_049275172.1 uncharacterized protein LOC119404128 isoform X5 [Rhipicephalus sanguineus]XP_049275173.1 uncharacterized protein LOC119404128 isoform X6 [R